MTRVNAPSAANLDRRLFLLEAAGLLGLTGCLGSPLGNFSLAIAEVSAIRGTGSQGSSSAT